MYVVYVCNARVYGLYLMYVLHVMYVLYVRILCMYVDIVFHVCIRVCRYALHVLMLSMFCA